MNPKKDEAKSDFLKRCTAAKIKGGQNRRDAFASCAVNHDIAVNGGLAALTAECQMGVNLRLSEGAEDAPGFLIVAKTGRPVDKGYYTLGIDIAGIRVKPKIPVLREHQRGRVVGYASAWFNDSQMYCEGEFAETADGREAKKLADGGYPWEASVGIWPEEIEKVLPDHEASCNGYSIKGPAFIFRKSYVREVSFCSLGADDETSVIPFAQPDNHQGDDLVREVQRLRADGLSFFEAMEKIEAGGHLEVARPLEERGDTMQKRNFEGPSEELARRSKILAFEKGVSVVDAMKMVLAQDKDLARRWKEDLLDIVPAQHIRK